MADSIGDSFAKFGEAILRADQQTHAGLVMAAAAILELQLEHALLAQMRALPKDLRKRLFRGYGPLSTFAAKIDLSFALRIIDNKVLTELNKIKSIRNKFAHSESLYSLDQPPMLELFNSLIRPAGAKGTYKEVFIACVAAIDDELDEFLKSKGVGDNFGAT